MKNHKPIHIFCETFNMNFYVSYGVPIDELRVAVKKRTGLEFDPQEDFRDGYCLEFLRQGITDTIWIWTRRKELCALVHECLHAVHFTMRDRKIRQGKETDEVSCYLLAMLIRKIFKKGKGKR